MFVGHTLTTWIFISFCTSEFYLPATEQHTLITQQIIYCTGDITKSANYTKNKCVQLQPHAQVRTSMHACMHACVHACMHACMRECMYACMYACGGQQLHPPQPPAHPVSHRRSDRSRVALLRSFEPSHPSPCPGRK